MQIPILNGIYADSTPSVRRSYPINLIPVPEASGVSNGFLRPGDGLVESTTGPGQDRGGINWNDVHYRVMGSKLVSISSSDVVTTLADVGGSTAQVSLDYSENRLGIVSNGDLFYWDGSTLEEVVDADLGDPIDMIWVDGYFMCTNGTDIVVTSLSDPREVLSDSFTTAEVDPDPIKGLIKVRNEPHAVGRYSIEVFRNISPASVTTFPFQRLNGAHIEKGAVGTHSFCEFNDNIYFLGGGRNEPISFHVGVNGRSQQVSTREIDEVLGTYTEAQLSTSVVEYRKDRTNDLIYLHLPDRTLIYDPTSSAAMQTHVWATLTSTNDGFSQYKAKNFVYVHNKWYFGDPTSTKFGYISNTISSHYGSVVRWEFGTQIIYNEGNGALVNELELIGLTGSTALGDDPRISTSYSTDGITWSNDRIISSGTIGDRLKRLVWRRLGFLRQRRVHRFRGDSDSHISFMRLEATLEPLTT